MSEKESSLSQVNTEKLKNKINDVLEGTAYIVEKATQNIFNELNKMREQYSDVVNKFLEYCSKDNLTIDSDNNETNAKDSLLYSNSINIYKPITGNILKKSANRTKIKFPTLELTKPIYQAKNNSVRPTNLKKSTGISMNADRSKTPSLKTDSMIIPKENPNTLSINSSIAYRNMNKKPSKTNITPKSMKMPTSPNFTKNNFNNLNQSYTKKFQHKHTSSNPKSSESIIKKSITKERSSEKTVKAISSYSQNGNNFSSGSKNEAKFNISNTNNRENLKNSKINNELKEIKINLDKKDFTLNCERKLSILDIDGVGPLIDENKIETTGNNPNEENKEKISTRLIQQLSKNPVNNLSSKNDKLFYILAKSNVFSLRSRLFFSKISKQVYEIYPPKAVLKDSTRQIYTIMLELESYLSYYYLHTNFENIIKNGFIPSKTSQNNLNFIYKDDEKNLLNIDLNDDIIDSFKFIYILLKLNFNEISNEMLIRNLIQNIFPKLTLTDFSKNLFYFRISLSNLHFS